MRASSLALACLTAACNSLSGSASDQSAPPAGQFAKASKRTLGNFNASNNGVALPLQNRSAPKAMDTSPGDLMAFASGAPAMAEKQAEAPAAPPVEPKPETARQAAPARAWFPETFLFSPRVVTDAAGRAEVEAKVPDRLTTWRVLALAHSREGGQAGAVASFRGTLPAYVDPVVPPFLFAGDRIRIPVQVVNTTAKEIAEALAVEVQGARGSSSAAALRVPAGGSALQSLEIAADKPGKAVVRAALGATDAVVRSFPIHPSGRPVELRRSGTLAAPRTLEIEAPPDLDPESSRVRLQVYPGALSLLRSELTAASARGGEAEDAYALLLAGRAPELLKALGGTPDAEALRAAGLVAGQRAIRAGRAPSLETAMLLAEAALAHPGNPVLARLGERLAEQVAKAQRPDGTFSGGNGWTLPRLLTATADGLSAVRAAQSSPAGRARAAAAVVKASGAFERHVDRIADGYTAAAVAASGAASGPVLEKLRAKVRAAVKEGADGARYLPVESGSARADGSAPSVSEATALAALALEGDPAAPWRADLGASLLSAYHPSSGWGDGRANLTALRAVLSLFKEKVPPQTKVTLEMDGVSLAEGTLDAEHLKDVLVLEASAAGAGGKHAFSVKAVPPLPGLGFSLALRVFVPWKEEKSPQGIQLTAQIPAQMKAGQAVEVALAAAAPAGAAMRIRHALPAGVAPDRASLEALVAEQAIQSFRAEDGAVTLEVGPRAPGQLFTARYRAVPTFAGLLRSGPSSVELAGRPDAVHFAPPSVWDVR